MRGASDALVESALRVDPRTVIVSASSSCAPLSRDIRLGAVTGDGEVPKVIVGRFSKSEPEAARTIATDRRGGTQPARTTHLEP